MKGEIKFQTSDLQGLRSLCEAVQKQTKQMQVDSGHALDSIHYAAAQVGFPQLTIKHSLSGSPTRGPLPTMPPAPPGDWVDNLRVGDVVVNGGSGRFYTVVSIPDKITNKRFYEVEDSQGLVIVLTANQIRQNSSFHSSPPAIAPSPTWGIRAGMYIRSLMNGQIALVLRQSAYSRTWVIGCDGTEHALHESDIHADWEPYEFPELDTPRPEKPIDRFYIESIIDRFDGPNVLYIKYHKWKSSEFRPGRKITVNREGRLIEGEIIAVSDSKREIIWKEDA